MDGPHQSCWNCAHGHKSPCSGYTYPLETYRCACDCTRPKGGAK